jgi:G-patch domain
MTIIANKEDTRNTSWSQGSIGAKLLQKMGWSEGQGLGRNQQGSSNALRAVRRAEGLGIGATHDSAGTEGWSATNDSFASVLQNLQSAHGPSGSTTNNNKNKKKALTLAKNRVLAGHAKKMRHAKDLNSKTPEEMACIFGGAMPPPKSQEKRSKTKSSKRRREEPQEGEERQVEEEPSSDKTPPLEPTTNETTTETVGSDEEAAAAKKEKKKRKKEKKNKTRE